MSIIVTRAGKGSALTFSEVDSNFVNLNTDKYQAGDAASLASLTLGTPLAAANGGTGLSALGANVATWLGTPSSANLAAAVTDETGSGALVFSTSPSLITPTLGDASATSINKVAITAPATSATLTIADGKTLTASNTLTFTGTDSSSVAFGTGGTVAYTSNNLGAFSATTSAQLAGVISDETGSGSLVFGTSPTLATPTITTSATVPLVIGGTGTTSTLTLRSTSGAGTTGATINFETGNNGATKAMTITNAGFVGINRTSPSFRLDVNGGARFGDATVTGVLFMDGATPYVSSSSTELVLTQTGDTFGTSELRIQNRAGANGALFVNNTIGLVDLALQAFGNQGNLRYETRSGFYDPANVNGELQWIDNTLVSPNIIFYAGASGLTVDALPVKASSCVSQQAITQNSQSVTIPFTLENGCNGQSIGPITVASGGSVTVPSGQSWIVY